MLIWIAGIVLLLVGYFTYGRWIDNIFGSDRDRPTPALTSPDGVDTLPLPGWKVFFIQLLDIAGIGPIFGPILGALYGPQALIWVVIGAIFAGGVHDYFSGMLSVRHGGASVPELIGNLMGEKARWLLRGFSFLLLLLVGVVFVMSPASLLSSLTGINQMTLVGVIFVYYFLATVLPIDKLIGRFYPLFGLLLLFMTFAVLFGLIFSDRPFLPDLSVGGGIHPKALPIWPLLFITLSCGAISGFHSTQSPIMARCIRSEKQGRAVFYGAMIAEAVIAMIWVAVGVSFYDSPALLQATIDQGTPALVVNQACRALLGPVGGIIAILGVIILPITSGDTAFRSSRLILAESCKLNQIPIRNRLLIAIPLFALAMYLSTVDFNLIWRYFGWSNQTLAALMLWSAALWLAREHKPHWLASLPATFMSAVSFSFILQDPMGLGLPPLFSNITGVLGALALLGAMYFYNLRLDASIDQPMRSG